MEYQKCDWIIDLGWLPDTYPAACLLFLLNMTEGEKVRKLMDKDREIPCSQCHRQMSLDLEIIDFISCPLKKGKKSKVMRKKDKTKAPSPPLQIFFPGSTPIPFFPNLLALLLPPTPSRTGGWRMEACSHDCFFLLTLSCCSVRVLPLGIVLQKQTAPSWVLKVFPGNLLQCGLPMSCLFLQGFIHKLWHRELHRLHSEYLLHCILGELLYLFPLLIWSRYFQGCFSYIYSILSLSAALQVSNPF